MCMDSNAIGMGARVDRAQDAARPDKVGLMYMLAGGTDASNTDPYATKPTKDNHWIKTGPHVMVVGAEASLLRRLSEGADPDTQRRT